MWARNGENGPSPRTERKDSLTLPPPTYKPPTMLCVQELYNQHENNYGKPRAVSQWNGCDYEYLQPSMTSTLCDEEESGPDWFRNMASSHSSFVSRDSSFINREDSVCSSSPLVPFRIEDTSPAFNGRLRAAANFSRRLAELGGGGWNGYKSPCQEDSFSRRTSINFGRRRKSTIR